MPVRNLTQRAPAAASAIQEWANVTITCAVSDLHVICGSIHVNDAYAWHKRFLFHTILIIRDMALFTTLSSAVYGSVILSFVQRPLFDASAIIKTPLQLSL